METIQNSIALKHPVPDVEMSSGFGTIQNSIALKHSLVVLDSLLSFGTIQNSIARKLKRLYINRLDYLSPTIPRPFGQGLFLFV
ncbi:hypothetical protein B2G65_05475 [Streptococcus pyogenes]|nr:hypothetical protein CFA72_05475 [Streptococcus pyogenes]ASO74185.1 hypothetical protein B2G65_05475 [Streptococcus pyogenes]